MGSGTLFPTPPLEARHCWPGFGAGFVRIPMEKPPNLHVPRQKTAATQPFLSEPRHCPENKIRPLRCCLVERGLGPCAAVRGGGGGDGGPGPASSSSGSGAGPGRGAGPGPSSHGAHVHSGGGEQGHVAEDSAASPKRVAAPARRLRPTAMSG